MKTEKLGGVAGGEGECGDDVAGWLVRERRSLDILPMKKEAKLLEPGDLRLGQVVIKRVAVVELGVNIMEVAMVEAVLVSMYGRIQQS